MKLTLTQQEAETILARELKDYLGLANVPEDFEVEIFTNRTATEDIRQAAQDYTDALAWQPGITPPPSREAFLAWAEGKKVCFSWGKDSCYHSFTKANHDGYVKCISEKGADALLEWEGPSWQEYTP